MNTKHRSAKARIPALLFSLTLLGVLLMTGLAAAPVSLTTSLLSDHEATEGGMQVMPNLAVTAGGGAAHALWTEDSGTAGEYKLFSRRMPLGDTVEIPGPYFEIFHPSSLQGESASDGRACFAWSEQSATPEGSTLYFWDSAGQTVEALSDDDLTEGSVWDATVQLILSSDDTAHALWEEITVSHSELFYWDEGDSTTRQLSDSGLPAGSIERVAPMVEGGGAINVAWSEWTGPASYHDVFYWDSLSESVRNLSPAGDVGIPIGLEVIVDTAGVAHLLWGEEVDPPDSTCPLHWDSASGSVQNLAGAQGGCSACGFSFARDDAGGVHAAWLGDSDGESQDTIFYWSTAIPTTTVVVTDVQSAPLLLATPTGTAHLVWTYRDDAGAEGSDLFHWDSDSGQAGDISDTAVTSGDASSPMLASTSDGQVFIVWLEHVDDVELTDVFFWNSTGSTTVRLSDPAAVSGMASSALLQVGNDGTAHVLWEETSKGSAGPALFYWNSTAGILNELGPTTSGEDEILMLLDADGNAHVAWISESGTGEGEDVWYWNAAEDAVILSDLGATEGNTSDESLNLVQDDNGRVYVVWSEQSGTSEGQDLFGAWVPVELGTKVYLPLVLR